MTNAIINVILVVHNTYIYIWSTQELNVID